MQNKRGRQDGGGGGGGKNKKRYTQRPAPSGPKAGIPLQSRGVLVSCITSKENQAAREAIALFTESYEQLGGTWKQQPAAAPAAEEGGDGAPTDIAAALASEVAELKDSSRQPFYWHSLGIHAVVYLEYKDGEGPSPSALVQHACCRVADAQQSETRFCSRFYPVEHTCFPSLEKIKEMAAGVVAQHFPADAEQPIEFAVVFDTRAGPQLDRMDVINAFAELVPKPHKVNLNLPQKTILVNVVKAVCGVAVVEQFKQLCRFNIRLLSMPEEEREAMREADRVKSKSAPAKAPATEQPAAAVAEQGGAQQDGVEEQQQDAAQGRETEAQENEAQQAEAAS